MTDVEDAISPFSAALLVLTVVVGVAIMAAAVAWWALS